MSLRNLLDGECGQNPALKVASYFTRDAVSGDLGASSARTLYGQSTHFEVSQLPPTTFRMESLLEEINSIGNRSSASAPAQAPVIAELAAQPNWAEEFLRHNNSQNFEGNQAAWVTQFNSDVHDSWNSEQSHSIVDPVQAPIFYPSQYGAFPNASQQYNTTFSANELLDDSKWLTEYSPTNYSTKLEKTELMITAEEFLKSVSDPNIKATEFMSFVEKIGSGELGPDGQESESRSKIWVSEYEDVQEHALEDGGDAVREASKDEFWLKLNEEWEKLAKEDSISHPWLSEPATSKFNEPYQFSEENSFQNVNNAFEEGKKMLAASRIPAAVLLFETAVQQHPDNAEYWMYLGTTQALNEQDLMSILALNKCLEIEPHNLNALMSLATSLTNESFNLQACNALKRWLKNNGKYSHLISEDVSQTLPKTTSFLQTEELLRVQRLFIQAARINPANGVDADVQCALGILFNLGSDYEKAVDCFQAALGVNPDNPLLWNRLGATLANGGKSSDAIAAYHRALELSPGYVRTRYNLGIACVNLGAYREAMEHFLTSLNMQAKMSSKSSSLDKQTTMSDSIWSSLRTSLHLSNLSSLSPLIDARDLNTLNRKLNFSSQ